MSLNVYDPNAIRPVASSVSVSNSSAGRLKSSSTLAVKWTLVANAANTAKIYLGDSNVAASLGIPLSASSVITFGPDAMFDRKRQSYDLSQWFLKATTTGQVATLIIYQKSGTGGPY